ncbi:MAG: hypothetical protein ACPLXS_03090 [Candidatus Micrarchaeales archaeon]
MKKEIILDFDGVGDSKLKFYALTILNEIIEKIRDYPKIIAKIDFFLPIYELIHKGSDKEKLKIIEEFKNRIRKEYGSEVLILSARKIDCNFAISTGTLNPEAKINIIKEKLEKNERIIYCSDSKAEIEEIERKLAKEIKKKKITLIKV